MSGQKSFWSGRRVLVTGADGFIGSHLTELLVRQGASVRAFTYYNSFGKWGWLDDVSPETLKDIEVVSSDIRDAGRVSDACQEVDTVFHLAALIAIPYSYEAPESYVQTNVQGTLNVLNACRRSKVRRLVHTSTSEVYGTARSVPISEAHPLQGQSPYSATKIGADMLVDSFINSFELPATIARPFNTYGPRQSARAVIPTILSQLHAGKRQISLGATLPTRDFNYVEDTVRGFLALAESEGALGKTVNLGSGREVSIGDLAALLIKVTGKQAEIVLDTHRVRPEGSEVDRLLCDASRARQLSGWSASVSLEDGLKRTSQWIEKNLHHYRPELYQR